MLFSKRINVTDRFLNQTDHSHKYYFHLNFKWFIIKILA